jgi:segregation and condensation protein B
VAILNHLASKLESLLFVADQPLSVRKLAEVLQVSSSQVSQALKQLQQDYKEENRGIQLLKIAGGYQLLSHPSHAQSVKKLIVSGQAKRLSQAALEALAIVAYRQPVTKMEVNYIRGVNSGAVLATLEQRRLIKQVGQGEGQGQPILYGTTKLFLQKLGLNSLKDLPPLEKLELEED